MNMVYYIFKFIRIWALFASVTILFSVLVMMSCNNIFKRTGRESRFAFYPIYNLLILLDIVKMDRVYFILLLFPIVNILTIYLMLYRLSIVFHTNSAFAFGLILLPILFLPILNFTNIYELKPEEEIKDDVSKDMVTMLTQEEYDNLNQLEGISSVDNVFKIRIEKEEPAPVFKANRIKYDQIVMEQQSEPKIETVEPVILDEIKINRFINDKVIEEDDSIEIVEL